MIGAFLPQQQPPRAATPMPRTVTIIFVDHGHFYIHEGEHVGRGLNFDELLGEVARLANGERGRYLQHADSVVADLERRTRLFAMSDANTCEFDEVKP